MCLSVGKTKLFEEFSTGFISGTFSYRDDGPQREQPILRPSPVADMRVLALLQDELAALHVCLVVAHPPGREGTTGRALGAVHRTLNTQYYYRV